MKKSGKRIQMALALLAVGTLLLNGCSVAKPAEKKSIRIGVTLYRGEDAFINNIRSSLEEKAKEYEQQTGIKVNLEIMDPKGNQNTQNSQVDRFLSLEYDAICVNMVDRSAASYVINKAMDAGTPVVFFNREPVEEDMKRWEHLYYVGEDARESAVLQGELLVDAYQENPGSLDLNEDGTVGYVMLEGERSHQGFADPHRVVGTDDARRRYSAGKTDRWFGKLGSEPGSGADGTVDPPVWGCDRGGDLQQR